MVPCCQLRQQPPLGRLHTTSEVGAPRSTPEAMSRRCFSAIDESPDWVLPNQST
jgi:hypothetical protein